MVVANITDDTDPNEGSALDASASAPVGLSVSAPADDAVTSTGLDSSRLSAAFGAAISAASDDATATGNEGNIDVGDAEEAVAAATIPGVNPGTPGTRAGTGAEYTSNTAKKIEVCAPRGRGGVSQGRRIVCLPIQPAFVFVVTKSCLLPHTR